MSQNESEYFNMNISIINIWILFRVVSMIWAMPKFTAFFYCMKFVFIFMTSIISLSISSCCGQQMQTMLQRCACWWNESTWEHKIERQKNFTTTLLWLCGTCEPSQTILRLLFVFFPFSSIRGSFGAGHQNGAYCNHFNGRLNTERQIKG